MVHRNPAVRSSKPRKGLKLHHPVVVRRNPTNHLEGHRGVNRAGDPCLGVSHFVLLLGLLTSVFLKLHVRTHMHICILHIYIYTHTYTDTQTHAHTHKDARLLSVVDHHEICLLGLSCYCYARILSLRFLHFCLRDPESHLKPQSLSLGGPVGSFKTSFMVPFV